MEKMPSILRNPRFAYKKEALGGHSDLVPFMAWAWLLKTPFHPVPGWKKNVPHSWEDTWTRAGAQARLGVGKCATVPRAWPAQALLPRTARETVVWTKQGDCQFSWYHSDTSVYAANYISFRSSKHFSKANTPKWGHRRPRCVMRTPENHPNGVSYQRISALLPARL